MDNLVFFDTETTGLTSTDRIISLALKKYGKDNKVMVEYFSIGDMKIPLEAKSVNHITEKMLQGKLPFSEYKTFVESFMKDSILVAHNAKFDIKMMNQENISLPPISIDNRDVVSHICTLKVAQSVFP